MNEPREVAAEAADAIGRILQAIEDGDLSASPGLGSAALRRLEGARLALLALAAEGEARQLPDNN